MRRISCGTWRHGFVSYRHTEANASLARLARSIPSIFLEFFGSQFGVFGPLLFAALLLIVALAAASAGRAAGRAARRFRAADARHDAGGELPVARRSPTGRRRLMFRRPCWWWPGSLARERARDRRRLGRAACRRRGRCCSRCAPLAAALGLRTAGEIRSAAPAARLAAARRGGRPSCSRASRARSCCPTTARTWRRCSITCGRTRSMRSNGMATTGVHDQFDLTADPQRFVGREFPAGQPYAREHRPDHRALRRGGADRAYHHPAWAAARRAPIPSVCSTASKAIAEPRRRQAGALAAPAHSAQATAMPR